MTDVQAQPTTLADLIERLEKATGPDRKLDVALFPIAHPDREVYFESYRVGQFLEPIPRFTLLIDAALTLIDERDHLVQLRHMNPTTWFAEVGDKIADSHTDHGDGPNGAIAVCIAALKMRGSKDARRFR